MKETLLSLVFPVQLVQFLFRFVDCYHHIHIDFSIYLMSYYQHTIFKILFHFAQSEKKSHNKNY